MFKNKLTLLKKKKLNSKGGKKKQQTTKGVAKVILLNTHKSLYPRLVV